MPGGGGKRADLRLAAPTPTPRTVRGDEDLALRPVRVQTGGADEQGRLVFRNGRGETGVSPVLMAVLVRLSDGHGEAAGRWFLEHGFGGLDGPWQPCFADLDAARAWITHRLGQRR